MRKYAGKVITARGAIEPAALGRVMMHEHLHLDFAQKDECPFDSRKWDFLEKNALPALRALRDYGCHTFVDMTFPPHRAEGWVYEKISLLADFNLILATGFYREIELGKYWIHEPEDQIWPFLRSASVEEIEEFCLRECADGIQSSGVRPGVLKAASSARELTPVEAKAIRAVARAHKKTGLLINTHANTPGAFKSQLELIESEGVDPARVCLGHTQLQLVEEWDEVRSCMQRGAVFSLDAIYPDQARMVLQAFDSGLGGHLVLGRDSGFKVGYAEFKANPGWRARRGDSFQLNWFGEGSPFTSFFEDVIPRYMGLGISEGMLHAMLVENPRRILAVQ
ncbi:MAG: hypothetical protein WC299_14355 [Kiritimatiellia bacterium]